MSEWAQIALLCGGLLLCFVGTYRQGVKEGTCIGMNDGFLTAIRGLCEGEIKVEGRKLIFDGKHVLFYNPVTNERLTELDMDKLTFMEDRCFTTF